MRRSILVVALAIFSISILATVASTSTQAEDLSPEQVEKVKVNCVAIKTSLNQLHASDALLRVNRGQVYESMASKLMDSFNSRLASNRLDNKAMATVTSNYRSSLESFRTNYIQYEQKLAEAIHTDCETQPRTFYTFIEEARELRTKVHGDVLRLHKHLDDYRSSVSGFLVNYERVAQ